MARPSQLAIAIHSATASLLDHFSCGAAIDNSTLHAVMASHTIKVL
jgi:hypothetical protein